MLRVGSTVRLVAAFATVSATVLSVDGQHRRVSISGQSAGGSMAIQHLFAFSSSVGYLHRVICTA
jgi:carboxylesterase type B